MVRAVRYARPAERWSSAINPDSRVISERIAHSLLAARVPANMKGGFTPMQKVQMPQRAERAKARKEERRARGKESPGDYRTEKAELKFTWG